MPHWEIGSEFDWSEQFLGSSTDANWFPDTYELFSTGTACLRAIYSARSLAAKTTRPRMHLPSFYCMTVARALAADFEICWYRDAPSESTPDLQSIAAERGDYILILNTFGLRERTCWTRWAAQNPAVVTIEDHSHDPFSGWAQTSTADYSFASLRKTLPIPDGGMLYSPKGRVIPRPRPSPSEGAEKRLTAMLLKNAFLRGYAIDKDVYRQLEMASQVDLESELDAAASPFTRNVLQALDIGGMRRRKQENIDHFLERAKNQPSGLWSPLPSATRNTEGVPLNVIVTCIDRNVRESLRRYLTGKNIFTAIHWSLDERIAAPDPLAKQLADRILTVPVDFRYGIDDVDRVFETMLAFENASTRPT